MGLTRSVELELWALHPAWALSLMSPVPLSTFFLLPLSFLSLKHSHCNSAILSLSCGDWDNVLGTVNPFSQGCKKRESLQGRAVLGRGQCLSPALPSALAMIPGSPGMSLGYDIRHTGRWPRTSMQGYHYL